MIKPKVTVLGSFVVDLTCLTPHLPGRGETVFGGPFKMGPGGKGSNQGIAAQKAGADVTMITKLGKDVFAEVALNSFRKAGMHLDFIFQDEKLETGTALILVENHSGENSIVVSAGACNNITLEEIDAAADEIRNSKIFLTQLETNLDAVYKAIDIADKSGVKIVLNPAPARKIPEELYKKIDVITPNETEASILSGIPILNVYDAAKAAEIFIKKGVKSVIITLGRAGTFVKSTEYTGHIPAFEVSDIIDTTGAGDAFSGGFVTAYAEGKSIREAVAFAAATAAISVTRFGTAPAMPERIEIDRYLKENLRK